MARIEHFAIYATDLAGLRRFYEECFQLRVVADNSQAPLPGYFLAGESGGILEIVQRGGDHDAVDQRAVCHLAFGVDNYPAAREQLAAHGVVFESDSVIENEAIQTAFFLDPAGNRCQIVWRREPLVDPA